MNSQRDELRWLVEGLPDGQVPMVLAEVRRHLVLVGDRGWPPAFFGAGQSRRTDGAARADELLDEGFDRLA